MTGFVVTAPTVPDTEPPINGGPFWPEINPEEIREEQRIDGTITAARLRAALVEAIADTNYALRTWRNDQLARNIMKLEDVGAEEIDDISILVHRYKRSVGCLAKALLLERTKDFDATGKGDKKADTLIETIDDCRRDHLHAISDIIGRLRTTVDLI